MTSARASTRLALRLELFCSFTICHWCLSIALQADCDVSIVSPPASSSSPHSKSAPLRAGGASPSRWKNDTSPSGASSAESMPSRASISASRIRRSPCHWSSTPSINSLHIFLRVHCRRGRVLSGDGFVLVRTVATKPAEPLRRHRRRGDKLGACSHHEACSVHRALLAEKHAIEGLCERRD